MQMGRPSAATYVKASQSSGGASCCLSDVTCVLCNKPCAAQRGRSFAATSVRARATIAELGARFIRPGACLLVHGHSRVVLSLLRRAIKQVRRSRPPADYSVASMNTPRATSEHH